MLFTFFGIQSGTLSFFHHWHRSALFMPIFITL